MRRVSTIFLQVVLILLGLGVLALLLWEPHLEGVNANATSLYDIYFDDPFLAYAYLGSIPFFIGLYQAIKILHYLGENKLFSEASAKALRIIKYCAFITAGAIVAADLYLMAMARTTGEDAAGAVALGIIATLASIIVGSAATLFQRKILPTRV